MFIIFSLSKFSLNKLSCLFNDNEVWTMLEMKEVNSKDSLNIHGWYYETSYIFPIASGVVGYSLFGIGDGR